MVKNQIVLKMEEDYETFVSYERSSCTQDGGMYTYDTVNISLEVYENVDENPYFNAEVEVVSRDENGISTLESVNIEDFSVSGVKVKEIDVKDLFIDALKENNDILFHEAKLAEKLLLLMHEKLQEKKSS